MPGLPGGAQVGGGPLPLPQMVSNLAGTINNTAATQAPVRSTPAAPASTPASPSTPIGNGPTGTNTGNSDINSILQQFQQQLASSNGAISSESNDITTQIQNAIGGLKSSTNTANQGLTNYFQSQQEQLQSTTGSTMFAAKGGPGGLAGNSILLSQIQNDNTKSMEELNSQLTSAIASNNNQLQNTISNLIGQQMTLTLQAKNDVVQNMIAGMGATSQASQAATAQAAQHEQVQNDIASLATKYGIPVTPGMTLDELVNNKKLQSEASDQEQITLAQGRSQINLNNAQAALAGAQAAAANIIWTPEQAQTMFGAVTAYGGPSTPLGQQASQQIITESLANPKNFATVTSMVAQYASPVTWSTSDLQTMAAGLRSQGVSMNDAIVNYVMDNRSIGNKGEAEAAVRAAYGTPAYVNAFSTALQTLVPKGLAPELSGGTPGGIQSYNQSQAAQWQQQNPTITNYNPYTSGNVGYGKAYPGAPSQTNLTPGAK